MHPYARTNKEDKSKSAKKGGTSKIDREIEAQLLGKAYESRKSKIARQKTKQKEMKQSNSRATERTKNDGTIEFSFEDENEMDF